MAKKQHLTRGDGSRGLGHIDAAVGAHLRQYRIRAGFGRTDLGLKIGVTFQQIQKYEKGTNATARLRGRGGAVVNDRQLTAAWGKA